MQRLIGKYSGKEKESLLLVTAGIHGNEPAGVIALERVFSELEKHRPKISGKIIGLKGNVAALKKNTRFIDEDLNRTWTQKKLSAPENTTHEIKEMNELISAIEMDENEGFANYYFLDCHSTSSESLPYISVEDVGKNYPWAQNFPVYIVRGFSSIVNGSIDKYLSKEGMTGFALEAGQHTAEDTAKNHEAIIWLALKHTLGLDLENMPCYPACVDVLGENPPQKTFDIIYRHGLKKEDKFEMKPGFENFQRIFPGEVLAEQNGEKILSKWDARIFMPLYQSQGNDGFFVIQQAVL